MGKRAEHTMETDLIKGFIGIRACEKCGVFFVWVPRLRIIVYGSLPWAPLFMETTSLKAKTQKALACKHHEILLCICLPTPNMSVSILIYIYTLYIYISLSLSLFLPLSLSVSVSLYISLCIRTSISKHTPKHPNICLIIPLRTPSISLYIPTHSCKP